MMGRMAVDYNMGTVCTDEWPAQPSYITFVSTLRFVVALFLKLAVGVPRLLLDAPETVVAPDVERAGRRYPRQTRATHALQHAQLRVAALPRRAPCEGRRVEAKAWRVREVRRRGDGAMRSAERQGALRLRTVTVVDGGETVPAVA